jgi:hypothetical protein
MGFGDFLRRERVANAEGRTTDAEYAQNLEKEAKRREETDPENAAYLRSRARFVKSRKKDDK